MLSPKTVLHCGEIVLCHQEVLPWWLSYKRRELIRCVISAQQQCTVNASMGHLFDNEVQAVRVGLVL